MKVYPLTTSSNKKSPQVDFEAKQVGLAEFREENEPTAYLHRHLWQEDD